MLNSLRTTLKPLLEALVDVKASGTIEGEAKCKPNLNIAKLHVTPPLPEQVHQVLMCAYVRQLGSLWDESTSESTTPTSRGSSTHVLSLGSNG
ncbi:hypothetical protein FRC20_012049 [Serendipita sp. 405]|nr:hypothetical protein FRC15_008996 [Serendipita sp. 397]KAG8858289.1 hypothetical protein FRC20_012049 [Serendipita sp. 405]